MLRKFGILFLFISFLGPACSQSAHSAPWLAPSSSEGDVSAPAVSTPTPLRPSTRLPEQPASSPTPDAPRPLPDLRRHALEHTVRWGDTLQLIAQTYQVSMDLIIQENQIQNPDLLSPGQVLVIPPPIIAEPSPGLKLIPDSELVYGPYTVGFDVQDFVRAQGGYLANYTEEVDGKTVRGAAIVRRVARDYSVNPRLLLAVLEYQSNWVTGGEKTEFPVGYQNPGYAELYRQLAWAANQLNRGYYLWRVNGLGSFQFPGGIVAPADPTLNAGTVGVQHLFSQLLPHDSWRGAVSEEGFLETYRALFGDPFAYAFEPLLPPDLKQPSLQLPFEAGVVWAFTGGPHGGWDSGSAWAALDFAPPPGNLGCVRSSEWVVAAADGMIVRSDHGAVVQSLDGDEHMQTGWALLYMHIETRDRVPKGTYLKAGERIGHPSCEGGISSGTHLHLARLYNGEWIPADQDMPFNLEGWISRGSGGPYQGILKRGDTVIRADENRQDTNLISRSQSQ